MKGVVFNVLEDFVENNLGDETWDEALDASGHGDKFFVGTKTYEDSILMDIFGKLLELKSLAAEAALHAFGQHLFVALSTKYGEILTPFSSSREVLKGLHSIIHVEVRKMMVESNPPNFLIDREEGNQLDLEYQSKRNLCALATGLLNGLHKRNNGDFEFTHSKCTHKGDDKCIFSFEFKED